MSELFDKTIDPKINPEWQKATLALAEEMLSGQQPHGMIVEGFLGADSIPMFQIVERDVMPRNEARYRALYHMRNRARQCIFFLRIDGQHESWHRAELENMDKKGI